MHQQDEKMTVTKNLCHREATKPQTKNAKVESESRNGSPWAHRGFPAFVLSCTISIFSSIVINHSFDLYSQAHLWNVTHFLWVFSLPLRWRVSSDSPFLFFPASELHHWLILRPHSQLLGWTTSLYIFLMFKCGGKIRKKISVEKQTRILMVVEGVFLTVERQAGKYCRCCNVLSNTKRPQY